ncbi:TetR/AcrR family transcriptional regulator [Promicromonospora sp. NPDC060271]|uniref:TetR/AcrR family transcriptional regulator n=1 Tax=Promicromonospora sp. NPDC060271 TaxID=3347089 RepID=UPI0036634125
MPRSSAAAESSPTVTRRLLTGTLELIGSDGGTNLSVRRLAEASGRSTMCVYTYFGGRGSLLAAAHKEASQELLDAVGGHEPGPARAHAAAAWMNARPLLALWLFTVTDPPEVAACRTELTARARAALDGQPGTMRLGEMVGQLVLDGHVAVDEAAVR